MCVPRNLLSSSPFGAVHLPSCTDQPTAARVKVELLQVELRMCHLSAITSHKLGTARRIWPQASEDRALGQVIQLLAVQRLGSSRKIAI